MNAADTEPRVPSCSKCYGTGECPDCDGWGHHHETGDERCPTCGSWRDPAEPSDGRCPACGGWGICPACGGSGHDRNHQ